MTRLLGTAALVLAVFVMSSCGDGQGTPDADVSGENSELERDLVALEARLAAIEEHVGQLLAGDESATMEALRSELYQLSARLRDLEADAAFATLSGGQDPLFCVEDPAHRSTALIDYYIVGIPVCGIPAP